MKSKKVLSILLVAALTTAAAGCGGGGGGDASSATAVEMRVQRQVGTVTLSNDKGENVTLMEKMRLNAGHNLDTAKESFVMVSFDETKVMTLEENGSASVVQKGNTLQFDVKKGRALVNLTEQLKDGQAAEVRSGNMVCGMTGTTVEAGKNEEGKPAIKVAETDNPEGVNITVLDANGNPTVQTNAMPGQQVVLQEGSGSVDKSNCQLEDFSAASLYAIGQNSELVQKTAETYGVPEDHVNALVKLVSTEGANAGPLNGVAAEVMEKALKDTKGATGDALNAEQSILTNTRQLLDKVMAGQMSEEDKKNLLNTANEQMNTVVKAALDAGVQGEDLNNIAKNVAESIANVASTAIDEGKSVTEITEQTKTTGTNLGAVVTQNGNNAEAMAQAIEQIRNTTAPQPAPQPAQNPAPAQPQTPQAGNTQQQDTPPAVDDDDSGSGNGGNSGSGGNTTQPSSSAEQPSTPQPSTPQPSTPQPSTQEPSSTADQGDSGNTGDSGSTGTQEPTRTSGTLTPHGGADYDYDVALSNNSTGTLFIDNNLGTSILTITSTSSSTTTFVLPMNLTASDGTSVSISGVGQFNLRDMSGIRIESQSAEYNSYDIMPTLRQAGEDIIITTANATFKKEPGGDAVLTANLETTQQNFGLLKEIMGWQTDTWVTFGDLEAKEMSFFYNGTEYCISTADNLQERDGNMIINAYEYINEALGDSVTFTLTPQGTLTR